MFGTQSPKLYTSTKDSQFSHGIYVMTHICMYVHILFIVFIAVIKHLTRKTLRKKELQFKGIDTLCCGSGGGWSVAPPGRKQRTHKKLAKLESPSLHFLWPPSSTQVPSSKGSTKFWNSTTNRRPSVQSNEFMVFFFIPATAVYTYIHMNAVLIGTDFLYVWLTSCLLFLHTMR